MWESWANQLNQGDGNPGIIDEPLMHSIYYFCSVDSPWGVKHSWNGLLNHQQLFNFIIISFHQSYVTLVGVAPVVGTLCGNMAWQNLVDHYLLTNGVENVVKDPWDVIVAWCWLFPFSLPFCIYTLYFSFIFHCQF